MAFQIMKESKQLRDYQQEMLVRLNRVWRKHRSVMVQMPTGTGKTVLLAEVIRASGCGVVLVVAHRRELIEQISRTLAGLGIGHGLIISGKKADGTALVQVASIQTLARRGVADFKPSLVIVDEAHHALAETYRVLWECWPEAKFLGLTATPCRLSGEAFTDLFDVLLQSWSIREFIRKGWLSDLDYVSVRSDSVAMRKVASLGKRGADGDYQTKEMANVLDVPESIAHLYQSYKKYADGKKGIVYAISQTHARHIAEYYSEHGVRCAVVDSRTPVGERQQTVDDYRLQNIDILVNVDVFGEGFDVPEVEFIQLARPTLSLSKYLQQLGRGMRITDGKSIVTILDQVGLYLVFGLPTNDWDWAGMFCGKTRGKGTPLSAKGTPAHEGGDCRRLVNEDMFRIKEYVLGGVASSEKTGGPVQNPEGVAGKLEVFREGGLYGVRYAGVTTCPAAFERIERMAMSERYFALGLLSKTGGGNAEIWTVIATDGRELNARMEGKVIQECEDIFEYRVSASGRLVCCYWDARYDIYYRDARMESVMGITFFRSHEDGYYRLRGDEEVHLNLDKVDILFNDRLVIIGRDLFIKGPEVIHFRIVGYHGCRILVAVADGLQQVKKDGNFGILVKGAPTEMTQAPQMRLLGLRRMEGRPQAMTDYRLRDYQEELLKKIRHNRRIVLQVPMGTGKNYLTAEIIRKEKIRVKCERFTTAWILVVAHRPEMVGQLSGTLDRFNLKHSFFAQDKTGQTDYRDITVISADQIQQLIAPIPRQYVPDLIVIDEAHFIDRETYGPLWERWPRSRFVGLTATPCRENGMGLDDVFAQVATSQNMKKLVSAGWLKDVKVVDCEPTAEKTIYGFMDAEALYLAYRKYADGKKGIVFAKNDQHAMRIVECYMKHGIESVVVGFDTPEEEREWLFNDFREGRLKVLVNVDYFSDGAYCPNTDIVQLARPTNSLTRYLHQVGCAMCPKMDEYGDRPDGGEEQVVIVLDHVGLSREFGHPTAARDWKMLFCGKKRNTGKKEDIMEAVGKTAPSATTKWQLRMQRLLENQAPVSGSGLSCP